MLLWFYKKADSDNFDKYTEYIINPIYENLQDCANTKDIIKDYFKKKNFYKKYNCRKTLFSEKCDDFSTHLKNNLDNCDDLIKNINHFYDEMYINRKIKNFDDFKKFNIGI